MNMIELRKTTENLTKLGSSATFNDLICSLMVLHRLWHESRCGAESSATAFNYELRQECKAWICSIVDVLYSRYSERLSDREDAELAEILEFYDL